MIVSSKRPENRKRKRDAAAGREAANRIREASAKLPPAPVKTEYQEQYKQEQNAVLAAQMAEAQALQQQQQSRPQQQEDTSVGIPTDAAPTLKEDELFNGQTKEAAIIA